MKTVLITGSAGFIGSHIADAFLEEGWQVVGLDNFRSGVQFQPMHERYEHYEYLNELTNSERRPDLIVHAAAYADVSRNWRSIEERELLYANNESLTLDLLEEFTSVPIVFLSTCATYGDFDGCHAGAGFYQEELRIPASSPYAASKLACEAYVEAYAAKGRTAYQILRLGCVVGSRYHHGHVADFVRGAESGWLEAKSNGLGVKSFVHVADVVSACLMGTYGRLGNGIYNCVSGEWSPRKTVEVMHRTMPAGAAWMTRWAANTHGWIGDPMAICSSARLRQCGWSPAHTIEQGVQEAIEFCCTKVEEAPTLPRQEIAAAAPIEAEVMP